MSRDDIIRMAREADTDFLYQFTPANLERFAALVAEAEREACALVCDKVDRRYVNQAEKCAERIRARG